MSTSSQAFPSFSPLVNIPDDIYRPLLMIAHRGYDAEDVLQHYLAIQNQLTQLHPPTAVSPYSLTPPVSACSPRSAEYEATTYHAEHGSSPMYHRMSSAQLESPHIEPAFWANGYTSKATMDSHFLPPSSSNGLGLAPSLAGHWSPAAHVTSTLESDGSVTLGDNFVDIDAQESPHSTQRPTQPPFDAPNNTLRKRKASDSSPYEIAMSSTAMPILVPSTLAAPDSGVPYVPFITMPGYANLPEISVIPSRKRAKATPKGVKTIRRPVDSGQPSN